MANVTLSSYAIWLPPLILPVYISMLCLQAIRSWISKHKSPTNQLVGSWRRFIHVFWFPNHDVPDPIRLTETSSIFLIGYPISLAVD
jgi:membrane-bound lytic murein transglycosylase